MSVYNFFKKHIENFSLEIQALAMEYGVVYDVFYRVGMPFLFSFYPIGTIIDFLNFEFIAVLFAFAAFIIIKTWTDIIGIVMSLAIHIFFLVIMIMNPTITLIAILVTASSIFYVIVQSKILYNRIRNFIQNYNKEIP